MDQQCHNAMQEIDNVQINFDANGLLLLNVALALVMFGVALGITINDFKNLFKQPKIILAGILSQFFLLPLLTFGLVVLLEPEPSIALGMIMVAACPGGNISNFMTHLAKGNTALSISLTACATFFALFMTPFNFQFYGNLYEPTSSMGKPGNERAASSAASCNASPSSTGIKPVVARANSRSCAEITTCPSE